MRAALSALILASAALLGPEAQAQHWNDAGPGQDLLGSMTAEFDLFRARSAAAPAAEAPRGVVPMLDWAPPPVPAAPPASRRRAAATR
jgi:hypothetical protein